MENEVHRFHLSEPDIAEYLYNNLVEIGYAPATDEVFDIAEMVFDLIMQLMIDMGVMIIIEDELVEDDE